MTMGERILMLRKQRNMTQGELAKRLGVGRTTILKYENGDIENLPRSTISKMATIFGVTPSYLMCFDQWDEETLSDDVALIERIQARWGKRVVQLLSNYMELNDAGRETLLTISESLTILPKYDKGSA